MIPLHPVDWVTVFDHVPAVASCPMTRWHDLILESRNDLATIMTMECGKPLAEAQAEITSG